MTTIYAISEGSYSDYRIRALFTTREVAEEAIVRARGFDSWDSWNDVEEFPLHEGVPEPVTVYHRRQDLFDDGTEGTPWESANTDMPWAYGVENHAQLTRPEVRFIRAPVHDGLGGRLEVDARSAKALRKAFDDRKAEWKAWTSGVAEMPRWVNAPSPAPAPPS